MKIGFVSRIGEFPEKYWKDEFSIAKEQGVSHLELVVSYPFLGPSIYTETQTREIKRLAKEADVDLTIHLMPNQYDFTEQQLVKMGASQEERQRYLEQRTSLKDKTFDISIYDETTRDFSLSEVRKTIRMAREVGAKLIVIHGGKFNSLDDYKAHLDVSRKSLEEINQDLGDVKLCIENLPTMTHDGKHPRELPINVEDILYLVKGLENIGICYDIGHGNVVSNALLYYSQLKKSKKVWDMHIHDNKGDRDEHSPLKEGQINFKEFISQLRREGYSGYLSIELDTWCEAPEKMEKEQRIRALEYIRKI
ncbi:MAG: sugar phosphate isomerase/epimerase [Nanoarchaeota archaeon]|nr:sugar phosphate isomerase/epimerase [Nanoarchaeota archaeon]MBU1028410.1 sugar phosphate isomerase/epimerase [Nanoarchaeota archaeon]